MTYRAGPRAEGGRAKLAWSVVTAIFLMAYVPAAVAVPAFVAFVVIGSAVAIGNGPGSPHDRPRRAIDPLE